MGVGRTALVEGHCVSAHEHRAMVSVRDRRATTERVGFTSGEDSQSRPRNATRHQRHIGFEVCENCGTISNGLMPHRSTTLLTTCTVVLACEEQSQTCEDNGEPGPVIF